MRKREKETNVKMRNNEMKEKIAKIENCRERAKKY